MLQEALAHCPVLGHPRVGDMYDVIDESHSMACRDALRRHLTSGLSLRDRDYEYWNTQQICIALQILCPCRRMLTSIRQDAMVHDSLIRIFR
jgi:hypothetical protein